MRENGCPSSRLWLDGCFILLSTSDVLKFYARSADYRNVRNVIEMFRNVLVMFRNVVAMFRREKIKRIAYFVDTRGL